MTIGGSTGIGHSVSWVICAHDATVYIAGRSIFKSTNATVTIKAAVPKSSGEWVFPKLNLADERNTKSAVEEFLKKEDRLDVLVSMPG